MALLSARASIFVAVVLIGAAQIVVAPGICCLLRSTLAGAGPCCHAPAVSTASRSCCHGQASESDAVASDSAHNSGGAADCLWCSAGPKTSSRDRVALPIPEEAAALPVLSIVPVSLAAAFPADALQNNEPFHRTAPAMCAWLCVWRK